MKIPATGLSKQEYKSLGKNPRATGLGRAREETKREVRIRLLPIGPMRDPGSETFENQSVASNLHSMRGHGKFSEDG